MQPNGHSPKGICVLGNPKCYCIPYPSVSKKLLLSVYGPAAQPEPQLQDSQEVPILLKCSRLTPFSLCLSICSWQWGLLSWKGEVPCQFGCLFVTMEFVTFSNFVFSDYSLLFFCLLLFHLLVNLFFLLVLTGISSLLVERDWLELRRGNSF